MGVVNSTSVARSPVPWHLGAIWTVFFLAFPIVFTGLVMRILTGAGVEFGSVQIRVVSFLIYGVVGCGIGAALVWLWASRRGVVGEIFAFRFPSARDWLVAIAGFVVGVAIFFPLSQWLARELFGADLRGMDYDLHAPFEMPAMICAVVIVAPFTEEVLFRGLGLAYLRRLKWPSWTVWLTMTIAFMAIHIPASGLAGAIFILFWGGMVTAIRLWRESLTPGWILHILNNATAYVILPLLMPHA